MFVRAYLRASTEEQNASRAKDDLLRFAEERGMKVAAYYTENVSGASLQRPELFRLLSDAQPSDILLVEQVDRLSRLTTNDWEQLKRIISEKHIRVVALDLPTSWNMANNNGSDEFTSRMFNAINGMLLDMLAAVARKDYDDRRRRQISGITTARSKGLYKGRQENRSRNEAILRLMESGNTWTQIIAATGASRSTLSRIKKRMGEKKVG